MVFGRRWILACCLMLAVLAVLAGGGCSMRHPALMTESEMASARADSLPLEAFLHLPPGERAARAERAERALRPLAAVAGAQAADDDLMSRPSLFVPYRMYGRLPVLGDLIEHLDRALGLDPSRADLWLTRGRMLDLAGDEGRARASLAMAWTVNERVPEQPASSDPLWRDIAVACAWLERDGGYWDAGLDWLDRAADEIAPDDQEALLLRGLLLAGRGDAEDAMMLSYGIPPSVVPDVGQLGAEGFLGHKNRKSDMLKRWLQAEVWVSRGRPELAWRVLGEVPFWRTMVVLPHRLYQDLGLYAELSGRVERANLFYALAYVRREYRRSVFPLPLSCDPVVGAVPDDDLNFYRLESGAYHGGSLAAYAMSTAMLAIGSPAGDEDDDSYALAMDGLDRCLRRGIRPAEMQAVRGQLRFSRGYYVLAEADLAGARARLLEDGVIDAWTSYLLGLIAMGREDAGAAGGFSFVSTAGGAFLEWLEGKTLPGVAALEI